MADIIKKVKKGIVRLFSPKAYFIIIMKEHLSVNASVYNGLYTAILRVSAGTAKKPDKVIKELLSRTVFNYEGTEVDKLCKKYLLPVLEKTDEKQYKKWSLILITAIYKAGIKPEENSEIILDELTVNAYTEWDDKEIYPDDKVKIITPAWYQNGKVIERGNCNK